MLFYYSLYIIPNRLVPDRVFFLTQSQKGHANGNFTILVLRYDHDDVFYRKEGYPTWTSVRVITCWFAVVLLVGFAVVPLVGFAVVLPVIFPVVLPIVFPVVLLVGYLVVLPVGFPVVLLVVFPVVLPIVFPVVLPVVFPVVLPVGFLVVLLVVFPVVLPIVFPVVLPVVFPAVLPVGFPVVLPFPVVVFPVILPVLRFDLITVSPPDACKNVLCEPQHDKSNKMTCAPSEDSDQPGHPPTVWSESSLCIFWVAKDPMILLADSEDSSLGAQLILLVLPCSGSIIIFILKSSKLRNKSHRCICIAMWHPPLDCLCKMLFFPSFYVPVF